jgi:hypothetical protein
MDGSWVDVEGPANLADGPAFRDEEEGEAAGEGSVGQDMVEYRHDPEDGSEIAGMTEAKTKTQSARPAANGRPRGANFWHFGWRRSWRIGARGGRRPSPSPCRLVAGFSGHIKAALRAEGIELSQKAIGLTIHQSTRCQRITA